MISIDEYDLDAGYDGYDLNSSLYSFEIRDQAVHCISVFFCDKFYWAGGSISKIRLYKEEYIKTVMEINIMDALALAYFCLEKSPPDTVDTTKKDWDVKLCHDCLNQCANRFIPKCHAGGILLVYLSLCHGVEFLTTVKRLKEIRSLISLKEKEEEFHAAKMEMK